MESTPWWLHGGGGLQESAPTEADASDRYAVELVLSGVAHYAALLGHANGDITTHYSEAELKELRKAAEKIVDPCVAQTPTLMIVRRTGTAVGKVSAKMKGLAGSVG